VFGPLDIQALKAGRYERKVQGKLPDVHVGVLDEVYKANSRVLNGALGVLQERKFSNSGVEINCPLVFCVGSSNELPEREAHLDAFRDRFLLRYNPGYFTDVSQLGQMLRLRANGKKGEVEKVGIEELSQAHHEAMALVLSQEAQDSVELVWQRLGDEGIVQSPRRYMQLLDVMAAESWLMGETGIVADSVMVARHVLWTDPKDIRKVEAVVRQSVNPSLAIAEEIHQAAIQAWEGLGYIPTSDALIQFMQQIARMKGEVEKLSKSKAVTDIAATLGEYQTLCMNRMLNPNGTGIAAMGKGRVN
jgi:MoxR-like ATPase